MVEWREGEIVKEKSLIDVGVLIAAMAFVWDAIINTLNLVLEYPGMKCTVYAFLAALAAIGAGACCHNLHCRRINSEEHKCKNEKQEHQN